MDDTHARGGRIPVRRCDGYRRAGGRLDFTLDEIEDLRIAIDEACAMLLAQAIPGTDLECGSSLVSTR